MTALQGGYQELQDFQSKARGHDLVKVVFDSYTNVPSLKESTPCRGNSKGIRSNTVDDIQTDVVLLALGW